MTSPCPAPNSKMSTPPLELSIDPVAGSQARQVVLCTALLRRIEGKRYVYEGRWAQKAVIVKVFCRGFGDKGRAADEWSALQSLASKSLKAPAGLFWGRTSSGHWALVIEKIVGGKTLLEVLDEPGLNDADRLEILSALCKTLRQMHEKGLNQKDMHLGNFLWRNREIFVLDAGEIRLVNPPLLFRKRIEQLALLLHPLVAKHGRLVEKLLEIYCQTNEKESVEQIRQLFNRALKKHIKTGIRNGLKKCLRSGSRYLRITDGNFRGVCRRSFCDADKAIAFVRELERLMAQGTALKRGRTCTVCRSRWDGTEIVIKRYNHKGWIHSLRHSLKGSRARHGWLAAHRLAMLGVATPLPLAYIEERKMGLLWRSYLVTEYVQGQPFYHLVQAGGSQSQQRQQFTQAVIKMLEKLARWRITHGDLKHSNLLVTENGPVLTDLDGVKKHWFDWTCRRRFDKDINRFLQ